MMVGMSPAQLKPAIMPFIDGLDRQFGPALLSRLDPKSLLNANTLRSQVRDVMQAKLVLLTAPMVKHLIEDMIRQHLGWLIVWGNVFGGVIGLITELAANDWSSSSSSV